MKNDEPQQLEGALVQVDDAVEEIEGSDAVLDGRAPAERIIAAWGARRKASTLKAYRWDLDAFKKFAGARLVRRKDGAPLTDGDVVRYLIRDRVRTNAALSEYADHLLAAGQKAATVRRSVLGGVAAVISVARALDYVSWRLDLKELRLPKPKPFRDTSGPRHEAIGLLMELAEARCERAGPGIARATALRDRAMLHLLLGNGLRRREVCTLDVDHVDFGRRLAFVWGKGSDESERSAVPIQENVLGPLRAWMAERRRIADKDGPLFFGLDRASVSRAAKSGGLRRLTPSGVYYLVREIAGSAKADGIDGRMPHPHSFRHFAISEIVKKKGITAAFSFARHSNTTMTMRYVDNLLEHARQGAEAVSESLAEIAEQRRRETAERKDRA